MKRAFQNMGQYFRKRRTANQRETNRDKVPTDSSDTEDVSDGRETSSGEESGHPSFERQMSESEFLCACCMELMLNPTTMTCGHTVCRHCLAQWFIEAKKKTCPHCKQDYMGHPKVNITLRNTINKLFPEVIEERRVVYEQGDIDTIVQQFEQAMAQCQGRQIVVRAGAGAQIRAQAQGIAPFWKGILCAASVAVLIWFLSWLFWGGQKDPDLLIQKSILRWSTQDVQDWLQEVGSWTSDGINDTFAEQHIDGLMLYAMNEEDLDDLLVNATSLQRRAFMIALTESKMAGVKLPRDLWEYKHLHLFRTLYVVNTMQIMPRTAFIFLLLCDYTGGYVPLLHTLYARSNSSVDGEVDAVSYILALPPTWGQTFLFWPLALMCPYLVGLDFIRNSVLLSTNFITASVSIVYCLVMTGLEVLKGYEWVFSKNRIPFEKVARAYGSQLFGHMIFNFIVYLLWNWIPTFLCNLLLYFNLYMSPCINTYRLFCYCIGRPWQNDMVRVGHRQ